jgi:ornithine decarboxylase
VVKLLLRVSFPNPESKADLSKKFGCTPEQAMALLSEAQDLGINVVGLSFHVGSQVVNSKRHVEAIESCKKILHHSSQKGMKLRVLDIGGGFPVDYTAQDNLDINEFCSPIRKALAEVPSHIKLIAEPGRFLCASSVTSISSVMGKALRNNKTWYYLDDGLYGTYNGQLYDHIDYPISVPYANGDLSLSALSGPTCDSFDMIREEILLPDMKVGDLIVGKMMGAYTWASASTFNFFPKANVVVLDTDNVEPNEKEVKQ